MFGNPEQNVAKLVLTDGMRVADFGAGTGAYTIASSKRVGNSGKVYAIEVQKGLVKRFEDELKKLRISNVICIWGDIEKKGGTKISDSSLDAVIVSNVFFQTENKIGLIDEAKRILKKGGKVLFIDWKESFNGMGPASNNVVGENEAKELFTSRGFKFQESIVVSPHHYGIIFIHE